MLQNLLKMKAKQTNPNKLNRKSRLLQNIYQKIQISSLYPSAGRYHLTLSYEKKIIWFRVAKVGTRTFLHHLIKNQVALDIRHASYIYYPVNIYEDYFKFAFVRNPWDRLVSGWLDKIVDKNMFRFKKEEQQKLLKLESFVDFLSQKQAIFNDRHFCPQSSLIDLNNIDFIGRMESFEEDMVSICTRAGIPFHEIESKNVTENRKDYRAYYTDKLASTVADLYKKDIQIFGYKF